MSCVAIDEKSTKPAERLSAIRSVISADLKAIDNLIINELASDIPLIAEITRHIIKSGGKRLRPLLVALSAKACGYIEGIEHHELAAIIEFVHTATLLHDDVVDKSNLRRGQETANVVWGNQASVLVGDFLYSRSFQLLTRRANKTIMQILSGTTNAIAEGEVLQLMNCHDADLTEQNYLDVIYRKTAKLFESCAEIGAILGAGERYQQAMQDYGFNLGMAFQIVDDLLDYTATADQMGKNLGDDLSEGKITLPLIFTLKNSDAKTVNIIRDAIKEGSLENLGIIVKAIQDTHASEYCLTQANLYTSKAKLALENLPESQYRTALYELIEFVTDRNY